NLLDFDELLRDLSESKVFCDNFNRYKRNNHYYDETLEDLFDTFRKINNLVQIELH
ncbi:nucleotidyl transferase AbiEii/AbiGii toxin family protein, partial [Amedibacillus dolichus]